MSTATRRRPARRAVVTAVAVAVAAGALGVLPAAPANATETGDGNGGTLVWGLSTYLNTTATGSIGPLSTGYVAPAAYDAGTKLSSFAVESAAVESDGSAVINLDGASLNYAPTGNRWLKFDDLVVDVDADGNGELSALVSYGPGVGTYPSSSYDPTVAPFRGPTRVNLVDLVDNAESENTLTEDAYALPSLDGTWSPDLITFLGGDSTVNPVIPALSYRSQLVDSDPAKAPQPLDLDIDLATPEVSYTTTGANYGDGLTLAVSGDGFRAVTNPGDAGVYVGLAESGGLPDVSSQDGMSAFAAADYVTPARLVNGVFTSSLNATTASLDPAKSYSLYTWQAHSHSNPTQDTETPVVIDWAALQPVASTVTVGGAASTTYGKTAVVTAAVPGKGTVTLTGLGAAQTQTLTAAGTANFTVPATLVAGSYTGTFAYSGGSQYTGSQATKAFSVAKALSRTVVKVAPKPTAKKAGKAKVTVRGAAAGSKVAVVIKGGGKTVKKTVKVNSKGVATVPLAKAKKGGSFKVTAKYAGDANHKASNDRATYKVAKPKKAKKR